MPQISFSDLEAIVSKHTVSDYPIVISELSELYAKWEKRDPVFARLRAIEIDASGDDFIFRKDFISGFSEDPYKIAFIAQGSVFERYIGWGQLEAELENKDILTYTNELLRLLGKGSEFSSIWQCIVDDGYEDYSVYVKPGPEVPIVDAEARFYSDDGASAYDDE
jgi:hypothetical protein